MALVSFCPSSTSSLPIRRSYSIPKISIAETLTPRRIVHRTLGISVYAHVNHSSSLQSLRCCPSSSSSSGKGEKSHSTRIFIKGLSPSTSEGFLSRIFSQFGNVSRVKIIPDRQSKQSLGFAYVWFTDEESAQLAAKEMDGKVFCCYDCEA
ncbi:U11/U12 small nuclear ribonucleoprotein 31 kDa protein isoform X2 [Macadamia integrifolia]|uniref:U11/U12 small nuclear ribonucleoprotein 31 kDa protein isoform X2 n=1 Tax=Macadamia integrifolia TaxID=60698 RepID=UPI001C4E96BE|nr:U11/U12 small nuclear ribonucleoprotein 31 kDa protein isoform X2 [Macadamia integrifolia]